MKSFGGIEKRYSNFETASVLLQSIPYDGTTTWGKGSDQAFEAFIEASENMELYDIETDSEVYLEGIHTLELVIEKSSPENVFSAVYTKTKELLKTGKFLTFFGGEHSISIGVIKAFYEKFPDITILQLDAHADLRKSYLGSKYNHACALHDASLVTNLVQMGIRSMDKCEKQYLKVENCFFAQDIVLSNEWIDDSISKMTEKVYLTIDLDVFDPSIMPSTGTPEPGGLDWDTVINYLLQVFKNKEIVGFDIVELAPIENISHPNFLAAKLYYKLLSYKAKYNAK